MNTPSLPRKKIITFIAITFAISSIFYYLILSTGTLSAGGGLYVLGMMWSPGLAGMATQLIYEHSLRGLGWKLGRFKYLLWAFMLPLLYCLVVYGITWLSGLGGFPDTTLLAAVRDRWPSLAGSPALQIAVTVALTSLLGLPGGLLAGLGEEIGWRGLFVPELVKATSFNRAALISGVVWALWHLPAIFFADYSLPGLPKWYAALMFIVLVTGLSFAFAWLRMQSGSLWPAAVLHASHNIFIQTIFTPLTVRKAITPYIIDEFGVGLALAGIVIAAVLWQRHRAAALQPAGAAS
jgi:membrane protease YdiL (CAAX protease family)